MVRKVYLVIRAKKVCRKAKRKVQAKPADRSSFLDVLTCELAEPEDNEGPHSMAEKEPVPCPERQLLASIIERAIFDVKSRDDRESEQAYLWLMSRERGRWSCYWVMEQLDVEKGLDALQERVKQLKQKVIERNIRESDGRPVFATPGRYQSMFAVS